MYDVVLNDDMWHMTDIEQLVREMDEWAEEYGITVWQISDIEAFLHEKFHIIKGHQKFTHVEVICRILDSGDD